ncbi:DUF2914 domain-containing protein [Myxococcota bacterium]|nr:DUF2914 domain-containing protein [Myxococcota bacterium]
MSLPRLLTLLALLASPPASALKLIEAQTCGAVIHKRPQDLRDRFQIGQGKVWVFIRLESPDGPSRLRVVWRHLGKNRGEIALKVGQSSHWRTWTRRGLRAGDEGAWRIELFEGEALLGQLEFHVEASAPGPDEKKTTGVPLVPGPDEKKTTGAPSAPGPDEKKTIGDPSAQNTRQDQAPAACQLLLNLRTRALGHEDRYRVAWIEIGPSRRVASAPGLVVRDGQRLYTLRMLRRASVAQGAYGPSERSWDALLGLGEGDVAPQLWHGYPATLPPPQAAQQGIHNEENNHVEILGVLGPYLGVGVTLSGYAQGARFERHRFATLRGGRVVDVARLFLRDDPDGRRVGFDLRGGGLRLLRQGAKGPEAPRWAPPSHLPPPPQAGVFINGCARVVARDGVIYVASAQGAFEPLPLPPIAHLLGVTRPPKGGFDIEAHKKRWAALGAP